MTASAGSAALEGIHAEAVQGAEKGRNARRALTYAANQTYLEVSQLKDVGFHPDEAWQMVQEEYLILRAEDDPSADKPIRGIPSLNQPTLSQQMIQAVRSGKREMKID